MTVMVGVQKGFPCKCRMGEQWVLDEMNSFSSVIPGEEKARLPVRTRDH